MMEIFKGCVLLSEWEDAVNKVGDEFEDDEEELQHVNVPLAVWQRATRLFDFPYFVKILSGLAQSENIRRNCIRSDIRRQYMQFKVEIYDKFIKDVLHVYEAHSALGKIAERHNVEIDEGLETLDDMWDDGDSNTFGRTLLDWSLAHKGHEDFVDEVWAAYRRDSGQ